MSELLETLLRMNLAAGAAVIAVMALRLPVRRLFGARVAYGLWSLAPLAALAMLLPARVIVMPTEAVQPVYSTLGADVLATVGVSPEVSSISGSGSLVAALWIAGGLASLAYLAWRQVQFGHAVREGLAGPAVVGVLRPRIVAPDDFDLRYTPGERLVVLAHEQTHIARHDSRINALVGLARCVNWFNPLLHVLAHYLRVDQEFACDAQVIAAHPKARRSYAEAMLKTQLAARPLPLGCYWPAQAAHPLAHRIRLLSRKTPGVARRTAGAVVIASLGATAAWSAWAAKPAQIVEVAAPAAAALGAPATSPVTPRPVRSARPASSSAIAQRQAIRDTAPASPVETPPPPQEIATETDARAYLPRIVRRRLDRTDPGYAEKVMAAARTSPVEAGSAVRLVAETTAPDGARLSNDFTAFGSQAVYRSGGYTRHGSAYGLYTSAQQKGDRVWVTATLIRDGELIGTTTANLASGQTADLTLRNGQMVTVTPTIRAETPEEFVAGQRAMSRLATALSWRVRATPEADRRG